MNLDPEHLVAKCMRWVAAATLIVLAISLTTTRAMAAAPEEGGVVGTRYPKITVDFAARPHVYSHLVNVSASPDMSTFAGYCSLLPAVGFEVGACTIGNALTPGGTYYWQAVRQGTETYPATTWEERTPITKFTVDPSISVPVPTLLSPVGTATRGVSELVVGAPSGRTSAFVGTMYRAGTTDKYRFACADAGENRYPCRVDGSQTTLLAVPAGNYAVLWDRFLVTYPNRGDGTADMDWAFNFDKLGFTVADPISPVAPADPVAATPVSPRDTTAPSMPGKLGVIWRGKRARIAWKASTDNVRVAKYQVQVFVRGWKSFATATQAVQIAIHEDHRSYKYRVRAVDAAGNASGWRVFTVRRPAN